MLIVASDDNAALTLISQMRTLQTVTSVIVTATVQPTINSHVSDVCISTWAHAEILFSREHQLIPDISDLKVRFEVS